MPTLRLKHHKLRTVPPHKSPWVSSGWWGGKDPYSQKAWSLVSSICGQKQKAIKILLEAHRGWPTCPVRYHSSHNVSTSHLGLNTRGQDMSGTLIPTFEVYLVAALILGKGPI